MATCIDNANLVHPHQLMMIHAEKVSYGNKLEAVLYCRPHYYNNQSSYQEQNPNTLYKNDFD